MQSDLPFQTPDDFPEIGTIEMPEKWWLSFEDPALSGVVVNDSLIMIDYANRNRGSQSVFEAIHEAGTRRFRPVIITTLTNFGGLAPIILETSNQANNLIPMAISLGFGIVFATAIILVIVPCLYLILDDLVALAKKEKV